MAFDADRSPMCAMQSGQGCRPDMNDALPLGPLLLPYPLLLVFAAAALSLLVSHRIGRRAGVDAQGTLWNALLAGALVARLAFVFEYKTLYFAAPWSIIDIRDGGWNATAGLVGAWLYALHRYQKRPQLRKALQRALLVGSLVFVLGTGWLALRPGGAVQPLPDLQLSRLDDATQSVRLSDLAGKPTVINLWATWCPPCVREMPMLFDAQRAHGDVNFVFVNQGEDRTLVTRWLQARQFASAHVLLDEKRQASAVFKQQGYPTTLFFDASGELVASRLGELSAATLAQNLERARR